MNKELWKLLKYHYRRAGYDPDEREFQVVLEKGRERRKVGEYINIEGTYHTPRQIRQLIEDEGFKIIAIYSCFRWNWNSRRYIGHYSSEKPTDEDWYGRPYVDDLWTGYYEKIDVVSNGDVKRYETKHCINHNTSGEKTYFGEIPNEIRELLEVEWLM